MCISRAPQTGVPREATPGDAGEEGDFVFELRTIADAGLVDTRMPGSPRSWGKYHRRIRRWRPIPLRRLHPIIGVVEFAGYDRATVADIPASSRARI